MKRPNEFKAHFAGQWDTLDALFSFNVSVANLAQKIVQLEIEYLLQNHTTLALWQLKTFLSEVSVIYDI